MEYFFEQRSAASRAAADRIVILLSSQLASQASASLVATGGSSPLGCYDLLARADVDWQRVKVMLSDERWVPPTHDDSNERMLREKLLVEKALSADFLPFYRPDRTIAEACSRLEVAARRLMPFACVLLGMGDDGHIASLFPASDALDCGMDPQGTTLLLPVDTAASRHRRISLTLAALTDSEEVLLLFFGDEKRTIYEAAKDDARAFPVSGLLNQKRAPVHVYWAP